MSSASKRVFLSYAHENLDMVRRIYTGLKVRKIDVWFDKEDLGPGLWKRKIEKAIPKSRYFIICISEAALKKTSDESPGFQDEELQQAYEIARVQPEDVFTVVPVRLEDCARGDHRLSPYQQYDLFNDFDAELDHLALNLGGMSLTDKLAEDTRTDDEKIVAGLYGKAATFYYTGDFQACLNVVNSIITLKPDDAEAWNSKGAALFDLGRKEEAIAAYDKAMAIQPEYAEAWYNEGAALFAIGQKEEAIAAYDKALEIKPDHAKAWYNKGNTLYYLGRKKEAIAAYDKALEIKTDYAEAWNNKGVALSELGRHDEAIETIDKALEIKTDAAFAWDSKGVVLSELGRHDEAIVAYDKALEIKPGHAEVWHNKGNALSELGRRDEAISAYRKALEIFESVDSPRADMVWEKLAGLRNKI